MDREKRKGEKPVPDHPEKMMNQDQQMILHRIQGFGWRLEYVRRPLFQEPVFIVTSADGDRIGILEEDGRLNLEHDIKLRGQ